MRPSLYNGGMEKDRYKDHVLGILRRLMAMDKELRRGYFEVHPFAKAHKVSVKTVRRDLELFRELKTLRIVVKEGSGWVYGYEVGQRPLFACNDPRPDH